MERQLFLNSAYNQIKNLLCIIPPYAITVPPAGAASLLTYLRKAGHDDFDFLDLRLWAPNTYAVTYKTTGTFAENFVMDIADLPLVLWLLDSLNNKKMFFIQDDNPLFERYCLEREINPGYLYGYLKRIDLFLESAMSALPNLEFVGFTIWASNFLTTLMAIRYLKRRKNPPFVVAGGPQVSESINSAKLGLFSELFDIVVVGEGEDTLVKIYESYKKTGRAINQQMQGTFQYNTESKEFVFSRTPCPINIKKILLPDFSKMDLSCYQASSHFRILPYHLSRGCTDQCAFCTEWRFWNGYRHGDCEHALDQIELLQKQYNIQGIAFTDSLLNASITKLQKFAERIIERGIQFKWGGYMRANMDDKTAALLKRAGFVLAFIGIESLSDSTLEKMNKRMSAKQNTDALEAFLKNKIAVRAGFVPGFPGDSRENFLQSASVLYKLQKKYPALLSLGIEPFVVSPGQLWYQNLEKNGLNPKYWACDYLDIAKKYYSITGKIYCSVDGNNQGIERLGRYRIAVTISQGVSNPNETLHRRNSIKNSDFMCYSYEPEEQVSPSEIYFELLSNQWFLACFKTDFGALYSCLMTPSEKNKYEKIYARNKLDYPWLASSEVAVTDSAKIRKYLTEIERKHLVFMTRAQPLIFIKRPVNLSGDSLVAISPFVVARQKNSKSAVLVVQTVNKSHKLYPAWTKVILKKRNYSPPLFIDFTRQSHLYCN